MKFDMTTAIITAIIGVIVAYLVSSNLILGPPKEISVKTLESTIDTTISEPNPEIFNYKAINPTVEAYVGNDCKNYDSTNNVCLDENNSEENNSEENNTEEQ